MSGVAPLRNLGGGGDDYSSGGEDHGRQGGAAAGLGDRSTSPESDARHSGGLSNSSVEGEAAAAARGPRPDFGAAAVSGGVEESRAAMADFSLAENADSDRHQRQRSVNRAGTEAGAGSSRSISSGSSSGSASLGRGGAAVRRSLVAAAVAAGAPQCGDSNSVNVALLAAEPDHHANVADALAAAAAYALDQQRGIAGSSTAGVGAMYPTMGQCSTSAVCSAEGLGCGSGVRRFGGQHISLFGAFSSRPSAQAVDPRQPVVSSSSASASIATASSSSVSACAGSTTAAAAVSSGCGVPTSGRIGTVSADLTAAAATPCTGSSSPLLQSHGNGGHGNNGSGNVLVYEVTSKAARQFQLLNDMRRDRALCDVTLCVGTETEIPGHRNVLASASPYFFAMFTGEMTEASQECVHIHGVDPKAMRRLVEFAYTSTIEVQEENVQQLLPAASRLQLQSVVSACCQFLEAELHPSNCLGVKQFADLHSCTDLYKAAENFSKHRFTEVCRHEEFLELSVKDVVDLMSADDLGVKSEEQVFEAALTWLHYSGDGDESDLAPSGASRTAYIGQVMSAVRLPMCTKHFLVRCADRDEMLRSSDEYKDLLIEALKYQLISPNERQELIKSLPDNMRIRDRHRGSLPHVLMVIGGQAPKAVRSVEKCDLGTVKWSNAADLNSRRCRCGVAVLNDTVYAIGGFDGSSRVRTVEAYDIRGDSWQIIASMNVRRSTLGAGMLGGLIYAVGGFDGSVGLDTVERYNAAKNEWIMVAAMSVRRSSVGVAAMGGYLYALGGYDGVTRHCLSSVECYDKDTDKWRSVADMNQTRSGAAVAVVGDLLYAIGGHDGPDIRKSVEVYEPVSDSWTLCASMICARRNAGAVAVDGMIYVVGGDDGNSNLSSVEMFDPSANAWYMLSGSLQIGRSYAAITAIERPVDDQCQPRQVSGSEHEVIRWK